MTAVRVLVVAAPLVGHLFPLVPLGAALRDAGHEVLLAAGGDAGRLGTAGLPVEDVAPGFDFGRIARGVMLRHPLVARAELAGTGGTRGVRLLFGAANDQIADAVRAVAERFRPDVVVHEPLAVAGALAAARLGVPTVLHGNNLFDGSELFRVTAAALRRHDARALPAPVASYAITPPSLATPAPDARPLRPVPFSGDGEVPEWLLAKGDRPRLLVSRSSVAGPGGQDLMAAVVRAAAGLDAEVVLVRPDDRLAAGDLPANVRTTGWVPVGDALPHCDAVVHHGGAGTVLGALAAGVPQLVVPGPGDRRHNAGVVAARGAGLAVPARALTTDHLRRLLADPALRASATEVREEITAMPGPAEVAATAATWLG